MSTENDPPPPRPVGPLPVIRKPVSGLGIAALVLGLVALGLGLIPLVGFATWVIGLAGVIFAIVGLTQADHRRGLPLAGLIVSAIAILAGLAVSLASVLGFARVLDGAIGAPAASPTASASASTPDGGASRAPGSGRMHPLAARYGDFASTTVTGSGDRTIPIPGKAKAGFVVATHPGAGSFTVTGLDAKGASTAETLVRTDGAYSGSAAWGLNRTGDPARSLRVQADGAWKLVLKPIGDAPLLGKGATGAGVFRYFGRANARTASHSGSGDFSVVEFGRKGMPRVLVKPGGAAKQTVRLTRGPAVILVQATGAWSIE